MSQKLKPMRKRQRLRPLRAARGSEAGSKKLMCEVCLETFTAADDVTHCCDVCGRCGFCEDCSSPTRHDCEPEKPQNADVSDPRRKKETPRSEAAADLSLNELRTQNVKRCEQLFHPLNAWTPADWACAMAGEAGEVCHVAKQIKRLETNTNTAKDPATMDECRFLMGKELADTVIYCDLLAASLGINLGEAIKAKFNEVSERMKSDVRL